MSKFSIRVNYRRKGFFRRKRIAIYEVVMKYKKYDCKDYSKEPEYLYEVLETFDTEEEAEETLRALRKYEYV